MDYLFGAKKEHRIQKVIVGENDASRRIADKCGFVQEGPLARSRRRSVTFPDGVPGQESGTTSAAPSRAASAVSSSGICWLSSSAATRLR